MEDVGSWLEKASPAALDQKSRVAGARTFWSEWEDVKKHFAINLHKGLIQLMEKRLLAAFGRTDSWGSHTHSWGRSRIRSRASPSVRPLPAPVLVRSLGGVYCGPVG